MSMRSLTVTSIRSRRLPSSGELQSVFVEWRQRARSRSELMMLDDRELWDMGLTRMDADNEAAKPFWQK